MLYVREFDLPAQDGVILRGWKVQARSPNGDWVMLFHGQSDNRVGTIDADFLLRAGYGVVMMDGAHGASGGAMATYGRKNGVGSQDDANVAPRSLHATENPRRLCARRIDGRGDCTAISGS